ncbi:unnamed protein product [Acanthosepion pharaonis]|uniref:Uncharacterized protein n=1 Tax=Acanthosepion pharaonis TaxID=158019 RepID=A0A812DNX1_ACAPH|nr:unnamed protein product [Sepia pharaonis]
MPIRSEVGLPDPPSMGRRGSAPPCPTPLRQLLQDPPRSGGSAAGQDTGHARPSARAFRATDQRATKASASAGKVRRRQNTTVVAPASAAAARIYDRRVAPRRHALSRTAPARLGPSAQRFPPAARKMPGSPDFQPDDARAKCMIDQQPVGSPPVWARRPARLPTGDQLGASDRACDSIGPAARSSNNTTSASARQRTAFSVSSRDRPAPHRQEKRTAHHQRATRWKKVPVTCPRRDSGHGLALRIDDMRRRVSGCSSTVEWNSCPPSTAPSASLPPR